MPSQLTRKVAPSLQRELDRNINNFVPIIVDVKPQETGSILDMISQRLGLPVRKKFFLKDINLSFIATFGHTEAIKRLKQMDEVNYISFDREIRAFNTPFPRINSLLKGRTLPKVAEIKRDRFAPTKFHFKEGMIPSGEVADALGYQEAQDDGITGDGVRVAVCGTGFMRNRQLRNVETFSTAVERAGDVDESGHETFTITEIAGNEIEIGDGLILKGLAPGVKIISVRCLLTPLGAGRTSDCIDALRIAFEKGKADIANNSLGSDTQIQDFENDPYAKAIREYTKQGKIIVFANGNNGEVGRGSSGSPADVEESIAVGSVSFIEWKQLNQLKRSYFSSWGPTSDGRVKPDIVSFGGGRSSRELEPEETIISSSAGMIDLVDFVKNFIANIAGTSMAAPWVSALIALWYQLYKLDVCDNLTTPKVKAVYQKIGPTKSEELGLGLMHYNWIKKYGEESNEV